MSAGVPLFIQASGYVGDCLRYTWGEPLGSVQLDPEPALTDWSVRGLKAVGITDGPFHLEAIDTAAGPVFLEVAARCGSAGVVDALELATGVRQPGAAVRLAADGAAAVPRARAPGRHDRHGWFVFPGHTLGSRYARVSGEREFRAHPLVRFWAQRAPDEPVSATASYSYARVPLGGVIGPGSTDDLHGYLTSLFTSVHVQPRT
jgi:hypothetical protein